MLSVEFSPGTQTRFTGYNVYQSKVQVVKNTVIRAVKDCWLDQAGDMNKSVHV